MSSRKACLDALKLLAGIPATSTLNAHKEALLSQMSEVLGGVNVKAFKLKPFIKRLEALEQPETDAIDAELMNVCQWFVVSAMTDFSASGDTNELVAVEETLKKPLACLNAAGVEFGQQVYTLFRESLPKKVQTGLDEIDMALAKLDALDEILDFLDKPKPVSRPKPNLPESPKIPEPVADMEKIFAALASKPAPEPRTLPTVPRAAALRTQEAPLVTG